MNKLIPEIIKNLRQGKFLNEASVSQGIVLPILQKLEWPIFDTRIISPEFNIEGKRVDFALCNPPDRPVILVEVKMVGNTRGADKQLFEYAFHQGVPMVILTDGQEWSFYLPGEQGSYSNRRFYKLDLLERSEKEILGRLWKYLYYPRVKDGKALIEAKKDHKDVIRNRLSEENLPLAWKKLLEDLDESLLELLADKVEDICGYKPSYDACAEFIGKSRDKEFQPKEIRSRRTQKTQKAKITPSGAFGYKLKGKFYPAKYAREVMISFMKQLYDKDPTFLERYSSRKHGRTRRYLARDKYDLYPPKSRHLAEEAVVEIVPGWWMGLNYSKRTITKIILLACEVANIDQKDFEFNLN